jgi:hypothetical protein
MPERSETAFCSALVKTAVHTVALLVEALATSRKGAGSIPDEVIRFFN